MDKKTNAESTIPPTAAPSGPPVSDLAPTVNLSAPLKWKTANFAEQKLLENLQGNILKGHGRDHTVQHLLHLRVGSCGSEACPSRLG
jgi:hypothetical protein